MKTELSTVSPSRRRLTIEVPSGDVDATFERVLREYRRTLRVPGFRPGKAPLEFVRQRVGKDLGASVADKLVEAYAWRAIEQENVRPIEGSVRMQLDEGQEGPPPAAPGQAYTFVLTADVLPEIDLREYKGVKVARSAVEVEQEQVESELRALRESLARMVPVEGRTSAEGDIVEVDIEGKELGGDPIVERRTQSVRLGDAGNLPEFDRGLAGLSPAEEFAFEVRFPEDFPQESLRGRVVYFRGTVRNVLQRVETELDDEIAKQFGEGIETVADLRQKVRESLVERAERESERVVRRRLMDKLLEDHLFEAPSSLVEDELRHRLEGLGRSIAAQGVDPERLDVDWKEIVEKQRGEASRGVRETLLLDAIAEKESLGVEQADVDAAIDEIATGSGEPKAAVRKRLAKDGAMEGLRHQLLRRKCLDWLIANANIV